MRNSTDMLTSTARSLVSRGCGNNSHLMYHPIGKKTHTQKQTNKNGDANHNAVVLLFFLPGCGAVNGLALSSPSAT